MLVDYHSLSRVVAPATPHNIPGNAHPTRSLQNSETAMVALLKHFYVNIFNEYLPTIMKIRRFKNGKYKNSYKIVLSIKEVPGAQQPSLFLSFARIVWGGRCRGCCEAWRGRQLWIENGNPRA
jgi:hypothetical protein